MPRQRDRLLLSIEPAPITNSQLGSAGYGRKEADRMIGDPHFDRLVAAAPVNFDVAKPDWAGIAELFDKQQVDPAGVLAASWCSFGERNIEALIDSPALAVVHPGGILSSVGKRKTFGKVLKFDEVPFGICKAFGESEHTDERGLGKYCIEFAGPGNMLIGRLQWSWRAKRFRDSRAQIMAVASERDRILGVVQELMA